MRFSSGIKVLKALHILEENFPHIQKAMRRTRYYTHDKGGVWERINADTACLILGKEKFWGGLARSAVYQSAERVTDGGKHVLFDSSACFRR